MWKFGFDRRIMMTYCDERILLVTFLSGPLRNQHQTATPSLSYLNVV